MCTKGIRWPSGRVREWRLRFVFFPDKGPQTLDALRRHVVSFHQFLEIVAFLGDEVTVAVRFGNPDDVASDDGVYGVEFHRTVFAQIGDVSLVFDEFVPVIHVKSVHRVGVFGGMILLFRRIQVFEARFGTFIEKPVYGSEAFAFFGGQPPPGLDGQIEYQSDDLAGINDQRQMIDIQCFG